MPPDRVTLPRFFVEGVHAVGDVVTLTGADARKLVVVLRSRSGDEVELCDSAGQTFLARLQVERAAVMATVFKARARASEPRLHITLAQAVPKGAKMDFVVEKATELGVATVIPLLTERAEAVPSAAKLERWRRLARAASTQSGRTTIADVAEPATFDQFLDSAGATRLFMPWELSEQVPLRDQLPSLVRDVARIAVVIGPEGGFSHAEAERATTAGAAILSLGSRILRTETAGLVLLSALLYACGEL
ncbi:MAG: 16S rRNA (uracil(1498)-N(3))-methyltransferase [Candidatus Eremiobacteraeota bacterium]|nr:16S rRNA (uracil(1498)-N(3))-methyltransferase [Candidatus Eremiobacteraeota bacterium]